MSTDNPRRRIDWNGEGQKENVSQILRSHGFLRKAYVPAAIGFTALALIAALAAGPIMRGMTAAQTEPAAVAADTTPAGTVETAAVVQPATAEATDAAPAAATKTEAGASAAAPAAAITAAARAPAEPDSASLDTASLDTDDPRWNPAALAVDEDKLAALRQAVDETVAAAEIATAMGNTEGLVTSGIPATAAGFAPERPSTPASERSAFDAALVTEDDETVAEPAPAVASNLSPAKATQYVNMRAGPDDDATVLTVVPANASIEAEDDCRWCEVSYEGKTGYIYRSFIARN
jgi:hypothetical protein